MKFWHFYAHLAVHNFFPAGKNVYVYSTSLCKKNPLFIAFKAHGPRSLEKYDRHNCVRVHT